MIIKQKNQNQIDFNSDLGIPIILTRNSLKQKGIRERINKTDSTSTDNGIKNDRSDIKILNKESPKRIVKEKQSVFFPKSTVAHAPQPAKETKKQGMRRNSSIIRQQINQYKYTLKIK